MPGSCTWMGRVLPVCTLNPERSMRDGMRPPPACGQAGSQEGKQAGSISKQVAQGMRARMCAAESCAALQTPFAALHPPLLLNRPC